jgi:hypothetical protein
MSGSTDELERTREENTFRLSTSLDNLRQHSFYFFVFEFYCIYTVSKSVSIQNFVMHMKKLKSNFMKFLKHSSAY